MPFRRACITALFALTSGTLFTAQPAIVYNESISGDLSNSGLSPTPVAVALGSNQVVGATGNSGGLDRDYFTISVPAGVSLSSIIVLPGTVSGGATSFVGLEAGNQVTLTTNPANTSAAGLLGWWHYGPSDINTNILALMSVPMSGSSGFAPPLPAGTYSFWIQDFNPGTFAYGFDIILAPSTPVPEPGAYATVLSGLGMLALLFFRRRCNRDRGSLYRSRTTHE